MSRPRTGCVGPHYLLKPFSFPALRDKLLSYGQMRSRLDTLHEPDQRNLDRVFGALRAPDQLAGAKGRSAHTLEAVERLLASGTQDNGGYRTSVLSRPSQRVTVIAVTGKSEMPRLRGWR